MRETHHSTFVQESLNKKSQNSHKSSLKLFLKSFCTFRTSPAIQYNKRLINQSYIGSKIIKIVLHQKIESKTNSRSILDRLIMIGLNQSHLIVQNLPFDLLIIVGMNCGCRFFTGSAYSHLIMPKHSLDQTWIRLSHSIVTDGSLGHRIMHSSRPSDHA